MQPNLNGLRIFIYINVSIASQAVLVQVFFFYITIALFNKVLFLPTITSFVWFSREFSQWRCCCSLMAGSYYTIFSQTSQTILGITPLYLSSLLHLSHPPRNLRSSAFINLSIPKVCTVFGRSAFRFASPFDWNTLQNTLKLSVFTSLAVFKQNLQQIKVDSCTC